jgi:hypothetical protein
MMVGMYHAYRKGEERLGNAHEHGLMGADYHGLSGEQLAAMKAQQGRGQTRGNKGRIGKALPGHVPSASGRKIMPAGVHDPTASTIGKGAVQKLAAPPYKAGTNLGGVAPRTSAGKPMLPKVPQLKAPATPTQAKGKAMKPPKGKKSKKKVPTPDKGPKLGEALSKAGQQFASTARSSLAATHQGAMAGTMAVGGGTGANAIFQKGEH